MRRLFPRTLLSGEGLARLLAVADQLPLCVITRKFGFEFPLCNEAATADLFVVVEPGSSLAAHHVHQGAGAAPGSAAAALGAWLDRTASDPDSFLARRDGGIILEYDIPAHLHVEPPTPGIFFVPGGETADAAQRLLDDPAETVTALWAAAGLCTDAAELRQVERVYQALSDTGLVAQAGVLPGRSQRAVRLVVQHINTAALPGLLDRLGWSGSVNAVLSVIAATKGLTPPAAILSLDVSAGGVASRLGLELFRPEQRFSVDRAGWRPMIELLTDRQWCLPTKADGLRAWPGTQWVLGPHGVYRVYQYINHIKVVVDHGGTVAKAYAGVIVHRFDE